MTTWYDELPPGWKLKRLRRVAQLNPSKREVSEVHRDAEVSFIPMEAVGEDGSLQLDRTRPIADVETGYTYFREGDVAFAKITPCFENGKGALMRGLIGGFGFGTTELTVLRPDPAMTTPEFLYRWLSSAAFRGPAEGAMYGAGGQKRVPDEFVREFLAAFPPLPEQAAIAAFLDRETAKIDALVEEQKRLIALLKEKRQAVISHAVTKGLNPDAPMKDSGIEWLGEVPEHWQATTLKRLGHFAAGAGFPHDEQGVENEELPFFKVNALGKAGPDGQLIRCDDTISRETALRLRAYVFPVGTIVFAKIGAALLLGRLRTLAEPACLDNNLMGFVIDVPHSVPFVRHAMSLLHFDLLSNPGTVPSLNEAQIANAMIAVPPAHEQREISEYVDSEIGRLDRLMAEAELATNLLNERRAALISAAVTGKINVRSVAQTRDAAE